MRLLAAAALALLAGCTGPLPEEPAAVDKAQVAQAPKLVMEPAPMKSMPAPRAKPVLKAKPKPPSPQLDQIRYDSPASMSVGVPQVLHVDIGDPATMSAAPQSGSLAQVMGIQRSSYYLIGLESELPGSFLIEPNPGQDQKQHRAQAGSTANWTYRVTPVKRGDHKLLYTLRVYGAGDDSGTVVHVEPVAVHVGWDWPRSPMYVVGKLGRDYGVWAALVGLGATLLGAWLMRRKQ